MELDREISTEIQLGHSTMRRRIKLMWDYGCWPLWHFGGGEAGCIDPDSLPLSAATKARLKAWAAIPDAKLAEHMDYPPDITWTADETQSFEVEDQALWQILQRELGESFYVAYHSTTKRRVLLPEDEAVA